HRGDLHESQRFDQGAGRDHNRALFGSIHRDPRPPRTTMPLRALLLDFDGVIADTENIHVAAWERTLADSRWEVPDDVCARAAEEDDRDFLASVFAARKVEGGDLAGWVARKQALTLTMLHDSPRVYPGVARLVQKARGRLRLAVVTGTWR